MAQLSASFSATIRVHLDDRPGAFADLARAIAETPADRSTRSTSSASNGTRRSAGVGAAGVATARILRAAGVANIVGCDRLGALYAGRPGLDGVKAELAAETNPECERGSADDVLAGADVYIGLSRPGAVSVDAIRSMGSEAIVFAMANPTPEVPPEEIGKLAAVVATGRSDYPNQINNVLAFPGIFRGALDGRVPEITEEMKLAAGLAIAGVVKDEELSPEYIVPSVFNREVVPAVAGAVAHAAEQAGIARRRRETAAVE